jgi:hypothetical protein
MGTKTLCSRFLSGIMLAALFALVRPAEAQQPSIKFYASSYVIRPGETFVLNWEVVGSDEVYLVWPGSNQRVSTKGNMAVSLPNPGDFAFTLRALYPGGEQQYWIIFRVKEQPQVVCTPPPCPPGGTLVCPAGQTCPGGCGVVCQTLVARRVVGFLKDSIIGAPVANARITCKFDGAESSAQSRADGYFDVTLQSASGSSPKGTCRAEYAGFEAAEQSLGTPQPDGNYRLDFSLRPIFTQGDGEWAIQYVANRLAGELGNPIGPVQRPTICARRFENGAMIWRSGDAVSAIMALMRTPLLVNLLDDRWDQRSPITCPPPNRAGLYLPDRGLGWAWCTNQTVRQMLGYSTEPGEACNSPELSRMQDFQNGRLIWVHSWNRVVYIKWSGASWSDFDFSPR